MGFHFMARQCCGPCSGGAMHAFKPEPVVGRPGRVRSPGGVVSDPRPRAERPVATNEVADQFPNDQFPSTYKPLPSKPTLIRGATVLTGTDKELKNTDVLMQDGKIVAVGQHAGGARKAR